MTIHRIAALDEETKSCSFVLSRNFDHETNNYEIEIISSTKPLDKSPRFQTHSTLALYGQSGNLVHHQIYDIPLSLEQMQEAEYHIVSNPNLYIK